MKLELEDGTTLDNPDEHDLEEALGEVGTKGNSFAILSQDQMTYVQTAGAKEEGYALEYQLGDLEHHYRIPGFVSYDQVLSVFKRYAKGDESWRTEFDWEREELAGSAGGSGCMGVALFLWLVFVFGLIA